MAHDTVHPAPIDEHTKSEAKIILLVEDDINIGEVLQQAISQETSFLVTLASDSFQALQTVKGIKPHLFILDYQLPGMNGLELYDQLHAIKELEHVPVLMMSAHLPLQELRQRKIQGMSKPIDLDEFLQAIENLVS
ncbi:hypothetical protein KDW_16150 [Dictyobacter vulcani]|uniref:Response regulatory domain-containing protein n=1 Tax=Dictyobacter vulcani TaxID=2607529 RepID=A0A5J4KI81_9CHLR|nr:response regulator [Dictyobacter vulcani]GER87453.1 hypothetical protein KDW_16150 [Dictyobacter vulcani]